MSTHELYMKKQRQIEYKQALDEQKLIKEEYKSIGNMTHAEKMLNRQGLLAYKFKDERHYAMIPGVTP